MRLTARVFTYKYFQNNDFKVYYEELDSNHTAINIGTIDTSNLDAPTGVADGINPITRERVKKRTDDVTNTTGNTRLTILNKLISCVFKVCIVFIKYPMIYTPISVCLVQVSF